MSIDVDPYEVGSYTIRVTWTIQEDNPATALRALYAHIQRDPMYLFQGKFEVTPKEKND